MRFGFAEVFYRGLDTGERETVSHVVQLNQITFEFQSPLNPGNATYGTFLERHGDAVKDIAFNCTDVDALIKKALEKNPNARVVDMPHTLRYFV